MVEFFYFLGICVLLISLILGMKTQFVFSAFLFVVLMVLFAFNRDNNDYIPYLIFFEKVNWGEMTYVTNNAESSPLFTLSMQICKTIGLNFDGYRLVLFFAITISAYFLFRNKTKIGIILLCYAIFPFWYDLVQLRYTWSMLFVIYSMYYAVNGNKSRSIAMLLPAILFHSMNILFVFLPFIPVRNAINPKILRNFSIIVLVFAILFKTSVLNFIISFLSSIGLFNEYQHYLTISVQNGYLLYAVYQIANLLLAWYLYTETYGKEEESLWKKRITLFNYNLQSIGILFTIFVMIDINFSRYFRFLYIMNVITFASYCLENVRLKKMQPLGVSQISFYENLKLKETLFFAMWIVVWLFGQLQFSESLKKISGLVFNSFDG